MVTDWPSRAVSYPRIRGRTITADALGNVVEGLHLENEVIRWDRLDEGLVVGQRLVLVGGTVVVGVPAEPVRRRLFGT